jgi:metal-responsive CopG/Arc/MetJ family transcriptional regulator
MPKKEVKLWISEKLLLEIDKSLKHNKLQRSRFIREAVLEKLNKSKVASSKLRLETQT